jgi:hypothetical protein
MRGNDVDQIETCIDSGLSSDLNQSDAGATET